MYQFLIQLISALVALRFTLPPFSSPPRCSAFLQNHELSRHERCRDCLANRTRTKDSSRVPWPKTAGRFAGSPRAPQANARGRAPLAPKCSPPDGNPTRRTRIPGLPPRPRDPAPPSPYTDVDWSAYPPRARNAGRGVRRRCGGKRTPPGFGWDTVTYQ